MSRATLTLSRLLPQRLFYGWYIVAAGALTNTLVFGITVGMTFMGACWLLLIRRPPWSVIQAQRAEAAALAAERS